MVWSLKGSGRWSRMKGRGWQLAIVIMVVIEEVVRQVMDFIEVMMDDGRVG